MDHTSDPSEEPINQIVPNSTEGRGYGGRVRDTIAASLRFK